MILRDINVKFVEIFVIGLYFFTIKEFQLALSINSSKFTGSSSSDFLFDNSSSCTAHISHLSEENKKLQQELKYFMDKNNELENQMSHLRDQCNSEPQHCNQEGSMHSDGDIWYADACTTCRCEDGFSHCYTSYHSSECVLKCSDDVCLNGGSCQHDPSANSVQCNCPEGFSGPVCEQTSCIPIKIDGECDRSQSSWYFDSYSNMCKPTDTDCYDPGSTFTTHEACSRTCLQGTCCYRMMIGDIQDMMCQAETMENCQALCLEEDVEVVGFYPGIKCPDEGCAIVASKTCHSGTALYSPGSKFSFGCDSCECLEDQILCSCRALSIRREIRDLSHAERIQYQKLLSKLQVGDEKSIWNSLRNLYVTHIMHANSPLYFLLWNRNFLRTMERHLQEFDCSATIPFFDFTLDAGNLSSSIVWRDDVFGQPESNSSHCKRYTIPNNGATWTPCIRRDFKVGTNVPTMVDVAMALTKSDFFEFTSAVQGISNYLHTFIGGDMDNEGAPADPIFYSLHAYIDMLFWQWQNRYAMGNSGYYNEKVLNAVLSPFNTAQRHILDSEKDLCVSYKPIGSDDQYQDQNYYYNNYDYTDTLENGIYSQCYSNDCYDKEMRTILNAGHKIQTVLYNQDESFLNAVPRTCSPPPDAKPNHISQAWNVQAGDFKVSQNVQEVDRVTDLCKRFCFTADIFLPPENESSVKTCHSGKVPTCDDAALLKCPYYTYVPCRLSLCGNCSLTCHVNNQDIDCGGSKIDFCSPNPCKNGGTCIASRWPTLPHLVTCDCAVGYTGEFCEYVFDQRCFLPLNPGKSGCGRVVKRWYFDHKIQDCISFLYESCSGNANNFPSYYECRISCMVGACCWRMPLFPHNIHGYSKEGYDRYGFNIDGRSQKSEKRTFDNGFGGDEKIYRFANLDYQGYDRKGYNNQGLDRLGYNTQGFHYMTRFNLSGYDTLGDHDGIIDFNKFGFNSDGYNRAGFNCFGYTKDGWDYYGLANGWTFDCRAMSLRECQKIENEYPHLQRKVISFSPGKRCEEVNCEQLCGCSFFGKSISVGTKFPLGCGNCECTLSHRIVCPCTTTSIRKEIRDLTYEELIRYQNTIKTLALGKIPSVWINMTELYSSFLPYSRRNSFFLPWHRYFLRYVEMKLQEVDCSVTIPYFDWTLDAGDLQNSIVWQANMFGGNGDKSDDFCVKNHPFKNHHPTYWSICLRRNFNKSVHLPNAVEIEKLSRLQSYEEFGSELNKISSLFHLFVGGHMATPDSMYDPIFLSFYAFIDKIWYDWIVSNPSNVEKFPQQLRFVSMAPFGVTPDDVLLSMTQLCVSYMQITEGAACISNMASTNIHSDKGLSSKQIFDVDGYDTEGYDKYGFDRFGWNRFGFNRDSFNRDGFDISGFDRQGYNRYGLDRHGCNVRGVCFFDSDYESDKRKQKDPWDDFNELGLRSTGVDFHGYDIYGFNKNGFDKENCSNFFTGPLYPKLMKDLKSRLKNLETEDLTKILRICPDVSSLPIWWHELYWLSSDSSADSSINVASASVENVFSPFTASPNVWLAPTPDERFCFPLQMHTKCELQNPPVPCPLQKCRANACSTQPSARCRSFGCGSCDENFLDVISQTSVKCNQNGCISMNGTIRKDDETWEEDICHICNCKAGLVSCSTVECETSCDHPVVVPQACCPAV